MGFYFSKRVECGEIRFKTRRWPQQKKGEGT